MFKKRWLFFTIILVSSLFTVSHATENLFYRGMRPMGMGGAFIAVADDENGRNWNPAGMMFLPGMNLSLQFSARGTQDTIEMAQDSIDLADKIQDPANEGKELTLPETQTLINNFQNGSKIGFRLGAATDLVLPKVRKKKMTFGMGVYGDAKVNIWIEPQGLPIGFPLQLVNDQFLYEATADLVPSFSGAYKFEGIVPTFVKGGKRDLSVGLTVKYVSRIKASNEKNPYTIMELINGYRGTDSTDVIDFEKDVDVETKGSSMGFDIGAITDLTDYMRVGMVAQDIGTNISYNSTSVTNDDIPMNLKIGTAFYPLKYFYPDSQRKFLNVILSADLDNLNGDSGRSSGLSDKLHVGAEMQFSLFKNFLFVQLRGGSNQGYPTYGVTLHGLWILQLDYTVYGDEFADYQNAAFSIVF